LNDPSNSIRVQAATAVAKIENQFMERLMRISEAVDLYPNDAKVKLVQAEHYDNYAFTGILDAERERINRRRALKHYQEYLELQPNDVAVRVKVGRLMLREKRNAEAADWFAESIERGYSSDSMMVWYLEALYASGRFNELRANAEKLAPRLNNYDDMRSTLLNAIRMWAGVPEENFVEARA
jgi:tetratricopeptide (TPR) repeat protein